MYATLPDLWTKNIESKHRERVDGEYLGHPLDSLGLITAGAIGLDIKDVAGMTYTDGRKGGFDPPARINLKNAPKEPFFGPHFRGET